MSTTLTFVQVFWILIHMVLADNPNNLTNELGQPPPEDVDFSLLCAAGVPLLREDHRPVACDPDATGKSEHSHCPPSFWCHRGAPSISSSQHSSYCCPRNERGAHACHLEFAAGFGRARLPRYWFDWKSGVCTEQMFTGIGGNENNFLTRSECERTCLDKDVGTPTPLSSVDRRRELPVTSPALTLVPPKDVQPKIRVTETSPLISVPSKSIDPCMLAPSKGRLGETVAQSQLRWYFDQAAQACIQFHYLGVGGNENSFESESECHETCGGGTEVAHCLAENFAGTGSLTLERWYFDAATRSCLPFSYSGRGGSPNRFPTKRRCERVCIPKKARKTPSSSNATTTLPETPETSTVHVPTTSTTTEPPPPSSSSSTVRTIDENFIETTTSPPPPVVVRTKNNVSSHTPFVFPSTPYPILVTTTLSTKEGDPEDNEEDVKWPDYILEKHRMVSGTPGSEQTTKPSAPHPTLVWVDSGEEPIFPPAATPSIAIHPLTTTSSLPPPSPPSPSPPQKFNKIGTVQPPPPPDKGFVPPVIISDSMRKWGETEQMPTASIFMPHPVATAVGNFSQIFYPTSTPSSLLLTTTTSRKIFIPPAAQPCVGGTSLDSLGQPLVGCAAGLSTCPSDSFCQIGDRQYSVCCRRLSDNPCLEPLQSGVGNAKLGRWYFEPSTAQCNTFMFHGFLGNANNFVSYETCQRACNAMNPCSTGFPLMQLDVTQRCTPNSATCPHGYFCHFGAGSLDTVCCPIPPPPDQGQSSISTPIHLRLRPAQHSSNPFCLLPIDFGRPELGGVDSLAEERWAWNSAKQDCERFSFLGSGGNSNNFETLADCRRVCDGNGHYHRKGSSSNKKPPGNSFGVSSPHNVCRLTVAPGNGKQSLHRFYFDIARSACLAFTYTGRGGNANNFETLVECRRTCPEFDNPCPGGASPLQDPITASVYFCSTATGNCPAAHWCHAGADRRTTLCCPDAEYPCSQPLAPGSGHSRLPRFYYDVSKRACLPFVYRGMGGNQNNFLSVADCEQACPVLDNPCADGAMPALDEDGEPHACSVASVSGAMEAVQDDDPTRCPANFYCHVGATAGTTLCCPIPIGGTDLCKLPVSKGTGSAVLNRWAYSRESQRCVAFVYSGRGGNPNNWLSRQDCLDACPEYASPCSAGQPHIGLSGQITLCGGGADCPTTYWCHIGATLETSVCCPGAGDPCEQDMAEGAGNARLPRFYYDQLTRTCREFTYTGVGGSENSFLTRAACELRCPVFTNPCALGEPQTDEATMTPFVCHDDSVCAPDHFCHIGASEQTSVCCPGKAADACAEPRQVGTGSAALSRFAYHPATRQCLPFVYSGLGGNQNNFGSRVTCEQACPIIENPCVGGEPATSSSAGHYVLCTDATSCPAGYWCHHGDDPALSVCCPGAEDPCSLPELRGTGQAQLPRWYFDARQRRCLRFTYSGTGGNANAFVTQHDCRARCPEFQNPCAAGDPARSSELGDLIHCSTTGKKSGVQCPTGYWCHHGTGGDSNVCCPSQGDPCLLGMTPGVGRAKLPRYYFSPSSRQCLSFTYTGVGGNENSFDSEEACARRCPVFRNPCPHADFAPTSGTLARCSADRPGVCPAGYWCHLGATPDTTVCCPGAVIDVCQLPVEQGELRALQLLEGPFTRWYFDSARRRCLPFQYVGVGGNANNFLTRDDCAARCSESVNPCSAGEPLRESGVARFCSATHSDCPPAYYCHVGASELTTVCCPQHGDACSLGIATGSGGAMLSRWAYDPASRQCQPFTYGGLGGNSNNFLTRDDCARRCPEAIAPAEAASIRASPCPGGRRPDARCAPTARHVCAPTHFCHIGSTPHTTVCCPRLDLRDKCLQPMESGNDRSVALSRWYYNAASRLCQPFTYHGTGGNENAFLTVEECRETCSEDETGGRCNLPALPGRGSAALARFYFNAILQQCLPFLYKGAGGNGNNFQSLGECVDACMNVHDSIRQHHSFSRIRPAPQTNQFSAGSPRSGHHLHSKMCPHGAPLATADGRPIGCVPHQNGADCPSLGYVCAVQASGAAFCCPDPRSFCLLPATMGNCDEQSHLSRRYAYDPKTDACHSFRSSGCGGNLNSFKSSKTCQNVCCNKGYDLLLANKQKTSRKAAVLALAAADDPSE